MISDHCTDHDVINAKVQLTESTYTACACYEWVAGNGMALSTRGKNETESNRLWIVRLTHIGENPNPVTVTSTGMMQGYNNCSLFHDRWLYGSAYTRSSTELGRCSASRNRKRWYFCNNNMYINLRFALKSLRTGWMILSTFGLLWTTKPNSSNA